MNVLAVSQLASQVSRGRFRLFLRWSASVVLVAGLAACDSGSSSAPPDQGPPVIDDLQLSVWVGADKQAEDGTQQSNNQLTLTGSIVGDNSKLYTYSDPECLKSLNARCSNLELPKTTPFSVENDDNISLTAPSYALLQTDGRDYVSELNARRFPGINSHQVVYFRDRFWLVPGIYGFDGEHDLWSSADGRTWVPHRSVNAGDVNETAMFIGRGGHQAVVFDAGDEKGEQLWLIGGSTHNDVWSSMDGIHWVLHPIRDNQRFPAREYHKIVVFDSDQNGNPELWLFGGSDNSTESGFAYGDIWTSTNGVDWTEKTGLKNADPDSPELFSVYTTNWVMGFDSDQDGKSEIWLFKTSDGSVQLWSSGNGVAWTLSEDLPISNRYATAVTVFDALDGEGPQLWLVGGREIKDGEYPPNNEVWSSPDGTNWTQHTTPAVPFNPVSYHQLLVADTNHDDQNELWLIGGEGIGNQTWSTENGNDWVRQLPFADFSPQAGHQAVAFDGGDGERLWMVGHSAGQSEVWSSIDGVDWTLQTAVNSIPGEALFAPREGHQLVVYTDPDDQKQKLWLIGGKSLGTGAAELNDVWSSLDGVTWTQRECDSNCFTPRAGHQVVAYDTGDGEQLWLVGGEAGEDNYLNDVWSSPNGTDWTQADAPADPDTSLFSGRAGHQLVLFDGDTEEPGKELWLIGGEDSGGMQDDVWSSSDGVNWNLHDPCSGDSLCFSARSEHQVVVYDAKDDEGERLWLMGGKDGSGVKNDVWSSTNGISWQRETDNAAFSGRQGHQVVVYPSAKTDDTDVRPQLMLIGGNTRSTGLPLPDNQIWRSTDGKDWQLLLKNAFRPKP